MDHIESEWSLKKIIYFWLADFETIVASGVRSAWAHGVASDKELEEGDMIVIDFGSFYHGYA